MLQKILLTATLFILCGPVYAAVPKSSGTFDDWSVWVYQENGRPHCYIYSTPQSKSPSQLNHGDVSFFVRSVRQAGSRTEASLSTGYSFASNSVVRADIGDQSFEMMVTGPHAWLEEAKQEKDFLAAMKKGDEMLISATSQRGNPTKYIFSLDGATAAINRMQSECP